MRVWLGIIIKGLFYGLVVFFCVPLLALFKVDERAPGIDDGADLGYDDDDPGEDIDGSE